MEKATFKKDIIAFFLEACRLNFLYVQASKKGMLGQAGKKL